MIARALGSLLFASLCLGGAAPSAAAENKGCEELLPTSSESANSGASIAESLVKLRDIGASQLRDNSRSIFTVSPDGTLVAFQVHQADPVRNQYCVGLMIMSIGVPSRPRILDQGHDLLMDTAGRYGWAAFGTGSAMPVTPRWGPDGTWIAYLKRSDGVTQVWRVDLRGRAKQVTSSKVDVENFSISADGRTIIYGVRPALLENVAEIDREGQRGWRFDKRAFPLRGARPQTPAAAGEYLSLNLETGAEREATGAEEARFTPLSVIIGNASAYAATADGRKAWVETAVSSTYPPEYRLVRESANGIPIVCTARACSVDWGTSLWWTGDGKRLRFSRREGWANSQTAIYEWDASGGEPRRIYLTNDALIECRPLANDLLCLREQASRPRHFVKLALDRGAEEVLFDPNPEFAALKLGRVERLNWRNDSGVPFFGDLVYPVGFKAGRRYPLIIVQYRTRGFLRGGVGDEVPIQAFANLGYFVLSFDNLSWDGIVGKHATSDALATAFNRDFKGRRNILSAIEVAADSLIERGFVDEERIGITGLSDGSTTVQFAAKNSSRFAAGSMGGCCWDASQDALLGPMIAERYQKRGWPRFADDDRKFWSQISLSVEPERVAFPILFQTADREYLNAIRGYTALSQTGIPTDLYIFPDEEHVKWQPVHRLAIYQRNIAWFDFWLRDTLPQDPISLEEARRWADMRERWQIVRSAEASKKMDKISGLEK